MRRPHKQIKSIGSINEESHHSVFDSDVAAAAIAAATAQEANKSNVSRKRRRIEDQVEDNDDDEEGGQEDIVDQEQLGGQIQRQIQEIDGETEERDDEDEDEDEDEEDDNDDDEDDEDNTSVNNNVMDQISEVPTTSGLQEQVNQVVAQVQASVGGVSNNDNGNIKESMFSNDNSNVPEEDILERSMKKRREIERTVLAPAFDDKGDNLLHHGKPLTNTKRAEQNRAAQRAFRMRRKTKIQELEEFEKDHRDCDAKMEAMRQEIERLKSYIRELPNNILGSTNNTNDGSN